MRTRRNTSVVLLLVMTLGLAGCAGAADGLPSTSTPSTMNGNTMNTGLTWQEAKKETQAMELEITNIVPKKLVMSIVKGKKGILLSCDRTRHSWNGSVTLKLVPGTQIEPIVKTIEAHYDNSRFHKTVDTDVDGNYQVQLIAQDNEENYIVHKGFESAELRIASSSSCFTLPEGIYPGGDF